MADRTALVVGARGVVGTNLIEHLAADGGWDVIGLSRRGGASRPGVRHIAADLLNRHRIFTVSRDGIAHGSCVRVTAAQSRSTASTTRRNTATAGRRPRHC